ncbi:MAG TPA: hypothetical protein PKM21_15670, partial [Anaerolineales bacterium]|nr:hypothetical protein [Anaerolineales bacterium]
MTKKTFKTLVVGAVLAAATLACSIGAGGPQAPLFIAPGGASLPTVVVQGTPAPGGIGSGQEPASIPEQLNPTELVASSVALAEPVAAETGTPAPPLLYYTQAGDTIPVVAVRFGVDASEITSPDPLPAAALLSPNTLLVIPQRLANTTLSEKVLPDSEVINSPSTIGFDVEAFVNQAGGYLSEYREWLGTSQWTTGAEIVERVALENSINPRLLLA